MSETPPISLFVFDLVLFREVEQLLLNGILDDTCENAAPSNFLEDAFELLIAVGEERGDELLVFDIDFSRLGVPCVFEFVL